MKDLCIKYYDIINKNMSQTNQTDQLEQRRKRMRESYIHGRSEEMYKTHINNLRVHVFSIWKKLIQFPNLHAKIIVDLFRSRVGYNRQKPVVTFCEIEYKMDDLHKLDFMYDELPLYIRSIIGNFHKKNTEIEYILCISREKSIENNFIYVMIPWVNRYRSMITMDHISYITPHITPEMDSIFMKDYSFLLRFPSFDSKCNIKNNIAFFLRIIILCKSNIKLPYWIPFSKDEILAKSIENLQYYTEQFEHINQTGNSDLTENPDYSDYSDHQNQRCICCLNIVDSSDIVYNPDINGYICVRCISLN